VVAIAGSAPGQINRASFWVTSDQASAADVPTFRLRATTTDASQSDLLAVESTGDGAYSPTTGNTRRYDLYYTTAPGNPTIQYAFDLLNFNQSGAATGTVRLDRVVVQPASTDVSGTPRTEATFSFAGGAEGFDFRTIAGTQFVAPTGAATDGGLRITPSQFPVGGSTVQFGWWNGPESSAAGTAVTLEAGRLYYGVFTVSSTATEPNGVPSFRLRFNETGYQAGSLMQVSSNFAGVGTALNVPIQGDPRTYRVFFPGDAAAGRTLFPSFDLLTTVADQDNLNVAVQLDNLIIYSVPVATAP
jgi:hypothetical protein